MKRKENFQWLPKEFHQLKYEAINVPQGSVRLVKKTQERKSSTCYLLITKGVTSSSPVPLKTRRERESSVLLDFFSNHQRKMEHSLKAGKHTITKDNNRVFNDAIISGRRRLGVVVDLAMALHAPDGGFEPGQNQRISMMQKNTVWPYDNAA
ncbi:uncharacterized protein TNCV_2800541 [Trichonephila clavipes]|nr:uncharacterized protein TNCV_2800541 [Trichonephila clavipes]